MKAANQILLKKPLATATVDTNNQFVHIEYYKSPCLDSLMTTPIPTLPMTLRRGGSNSDGVGNSEKIFVFTMNRMSTNGEEAPWG